MTYQSGAERMFANMLAFLHAPTWGESRRILLNHPELMNDAGYGMLSIIATDPETVSRIYPHLGRAEREGLIQQHHSLLVRCRQVGVPQAFVELAHDAMVRKWAAMVAADLAAAAADALAAFDAVAHRDEALPHETLNPGPGPQATARRRWPRSLLAVGAAVAVVSTVVALGRDGGVGESGAGEPGAGAAPDPTAAAASALAAGVPKPPGYGDPTAGPAGSRTTPPGTGQTQPTTAVGPPQAPGTPSNVTVTAVSANTIRVRWTDNSTNETRFEINNGDRSVTANANATSYNWGGLGPGTYMCFRVRAVNSAGASPFAPTGSPYYRCTTTPVEAMPDPPSYVYPTNGQTLDYEGAYMFKVTAVFGASGYLFGFFQGGVMVWENYRDEGSLSGTEYAIWPGTEAHSRFQVGNVAVWARANVGGQWTEARIITIHLVPR
jgi:hypothetical protein